MNNKLPIEYKVGDESDHGKKISHIVAQHEDYLVYVAEDGKPGFECSNELHHKKLKFIIKHDEIVWKCFNSLPNIHRKSVLMQESYALANIFAINEGSLECFDSTEKLFNAKIREYFCLWYLLGAFIPTVVIGVFTLLSYFNLLNGLAEHVMILLLCGLLGSIGAFTSILQRFSKVKFNSFHSKSFYWITGLSKGMIGSTFGVIILFLIKGNVLLGVAQDNIWYLLALSFLSGINERFVPDLLERSIPEISKVE